MRERLAAGILNRLMPMLDGITSPAILAEYRCRSFLTGQDVLVRRMEETGRAARVIGVDDDFRLLVRYEDGSTEALDSGEVSVRPNA
jgi:BirA family biotin operon repressor/biotin-[acetyl-CoA-carboxylase] ligase